MSARLREALVVVAEAIEDGNVDLAHEVALTALELRSTVDRDDRRQLCDQCGAGPMFPGPLEDHVRRVHTTPHGPRTAPPRRLLRSTPGGRS